MTPVVVTTTDPDGWWWACPGVLAPTDDALISVAISGPVVAARTVAVHLVTQDQTALADRFARDRYDFDGLAVAPGLGGVPVLTSVPDRLYCQVVRTVIAGETTRVFGIPATEVRRAA